MREFVMHYNIQSMVVKYQSKARTRRNRPMKPYTAHKLSRLRSKTFAVQVDDIDLWFAVSQLTEPKVPSVGVLLNVGVTVVNPGELDLYRILKTMRNQLNSKKLDPAKRQGFPPITEIEDKMTKFKPDHYNRKLGAERAKASMQFEKFQISEVKIEKDRAHVTLVSETLNVSFGYVKNFKTGSVRMYLMEVDGQDAQSMMEYA